MMGSFNFRVCFIIVATPCPDLESNHGGSKVGPGQLICIYFIIVVKKQKFEKTYKNSIMHDFVIRAKFDNFFTFSQFFAF